MHEASQFEALLLAERPRLVRLCARMSGSPEAAEDLAQETLLQAWHHADRLRHWDNPAGWLAAIARNVCLHWSRRHRRELSRLPSLDATAELPDELDLELELERAELATLLDRALALLPESARSLLVQKYVEALPAAEIAARLRLNENVVAVRLHRGKIAFRRVLATELRADALAHGLIADDETEWRATPMWCIECGRQRLLASVPPSPGTIAFRCPGCDPNPAQVASSFRLGNAHFAMLLGALTRPTSIFRAASGWAHGYFLHALSEPAVPCTNCGAAASVHLQPYDPAASSEPLPFVYIVCSRCGEAVSTSLAGLVTNLPAVQQFWRTHKLIQRSAGDPIEVDGRPALVTSFASVQSTAWIDVVVALDPFRILAIHSAP